MISVSVCASGDFYETEYLDKWPINRIGIFIGRASTGGSHSSQVYFGK